MVLTETSVPKRKQFESKGVDTETRRQALAEFESRFPGFKELLPLMDETVIDVLCKDINLRKKLKTTNLKDPEALKKGAEEAKEYSFNFRLQQAIDRLERSNQRLLIAKSIQRNHK